LTRFERADALVDGFAELIEVETVLRLSRTLGSVPHGDVFWHGESVVLVRCMSGGGADIAIINVKPAVDQCRV